MGIGGADFTFAGGGAELGGVGEADETGAFTSGGAGTFGFSSTGRTTCGSTLAGTLVSTGSEAFSSAGTGRAFSLCSMHQPERAT